MKSCKFYTASTLHFSMHNNLEESTEYRYADPLPFESCCNPEVMKEVGSKQAACAFTTNNSECPKFQSEETSIIYSSTRDTTDRNRIVLTETRSRYGFVLREIIEENVRDPEAPLTKLHSIHGGTFDTYDELEEFCDDLFKFEQESRGYKDRIIYPRDGIDDSLAIRLNENSYKQESFMKEVFEYA